jgi:hypothetical protein
MSEANVKRAAASGRSHNDGLLKSNVGHDRGFDGGEVTLVAKSP